MNLELLLLLVKMKAVKAMFWMGCHKFVLELEIMLHLTRTTLGAVKSYAQISLQTLAE